MKLFDVNAAIGPQFGPREGRFVGAEELLEEMDRFAIDEALVSHFLAAEWDTGAGNRRLLEELAGRPRLKACWVLDVPPFGEPPDFEATVRGAIEAGVRAARLPWGGPLSAVSVLDLDAFGGLFGALERRRMPVLLVNDAGTDLGGQEIVQVKALCRAHPGLPVILAAPKLSRDIQVLYAALERCRNLHVATCGLHAGGAPEDIARRVGAGQLVFGTGFPWFGGGQAAVALAYADLPEPDREAVGHGNLDRLLEEVR